MGYPTPKQREEMKGVRPGTPPQGPAPCSIAVSRTGGPVTDALVRMVKKLYAERMRQFVRDQRGGC
jgi:hypothetical protein